MVKHPSFDLSIMAESSQYHDTDDVPSRTEVIEACRWPGREFLSAADTDPEVIKLRGFAIKHGSVDISEFHTQRGARQLVDPDILKVPKVYTFFQQDEEGFLVLEHVPDRTLSILDSKSIAAIADALIHLHGFTRSTQGPVSGGTSKGLLWDNDKPIIFTSKYYLEEHLNRKLLHTSRRIDLRDCRLSFTHLDPVPRNVRFTQDGRACPLDWGSAGYYPPWFERCALRLNTGSNGTDIEYCQLLEEALQSASVADETEQFYICQMLTVVYNNIRYSW
nr:hypothetical protein B0A51_10917 [Rachicladosporium sp. CCFEE 5018]